MPYVVMVRCPTVDKAVPTGVVCDLKGFSALCQPASLLCPERGAIHVWSAADAWLRDASFADHNASPLASSGGKST